MGVDPPLDDASQEIARLRSRLAELECQADESRRIARRLAARDAITQVLSESPSLAAAAPGLLRAVCETLEWQVGALWTVEPHVGLIHCVEIWHCGEELFPSFE